MPRPRKPLPPADMMLAQNEALGRFILRKCVIFRTMLPARCDISLDRRMFLQDVPLEFTQDESGNDCQRESQPSQESCYWPYSARAGDDRRLGPRWANW